MDEARFEMLLSTLREGRSPAGLAVLRPEVVGAELSRRWQAYAHRAAAVLHGAQLARNGADCRRNAMRGGVAL